MIAYQMCKADDLHKGLEVGKDPLSRAPHLLALRRKLIWRH